MSNSRYVLAVLAMLSVSAPCTLTASIITESGSTATSFNSASVTVTNGVANVNQAQNTAQILVGAFDNDPFSLAPAGSTINSVSLSYFVSNPVITAPSGVSTSDSINIGAVTVFSACGNQLTPNSFSNLSGNSGTLSLSLPGCAGGRINPVYLGTDTLGITSWPAADGVYNASLSFQIGETYTVDYTPATVTPEPNLGLAEAVLLLGSGGVLAFRKLRA